jgi:NAD(P)-dependent dehydrogenase (short-subunit alcohol dehydrogenase family)
VSTGAGSLAGQWALVTGASKGIGFGIAERLVGDGAHVVLVARNADDLDEAARRLAKDAAPGQQLVVRTADTADRGAVTDLFAWVRGELPGLNVLVANAGSGAVIPFLELPVEAWDATIALNLTGTFLCMQEAARMMVEMPEGSNRSIVVVSSIRALGVRPGLAAYASTKAALNQLVRTAAYELAPHGVRVNALSPGITMTPLVAANLESDPGLLAERTAGVPMGRAGLPEDMGSAALFLCQPASAFVTGTNLVVDGGESLA